MKCYGLIGFPLTHSFSQKYFTDKFEREGIIHCSYSNFPLENIGLLPHLIDSNEDLAGLNVTIPYKEQVIPYLDEVDDNIPLIGAVNTLKITRQGGKVHLKGYNTDAIGFLRELGAAGVNHAGIVYASQYTPIGEIIRGLMLICQVLDSTEMRGQVEYL